MVEALKHLSKRALSNPLDNFVSVGNLVMFITYILVLVIIKAIVLHSIGCLHALGLPLQQVKEVDLVVLEYLSLLEVKEELAQVEDHVSGVHGELDLETAASLLALLDALVGCIIGQAGHAGTATLLHASTHV